MAPFKTKVRFPRHRAAGVPRKTQAALILLSAGTAVLAWWALGAGAASCRSAVSVNLKTYACTTTVEGSDGTFSFSGCIRTDESEDSKTESRGGAGDDKVEVEPSEDETSRGSGDARDYTASRARDSFDPRVN